MDGQMCTVANLGRKCS